MFSWTIEYFAQEMILEWISPTMASNPPGRSIFLSARPYYIGISPGEATIFHLSTGRETQKPKKRKNDKYKVVGPA